MRVEKSMNAPVGDDRCNGLGRDPVPIRCLQAFCSSCAPINSHDLAGTRLDQPLIGGHATWGFGHPEIQDANRSDFPFENGGKLQGFYAETI